MGITWEGGGQIGGATLILWAWARKYKKRLQRGGKFWRKLYNLKLFVMCRFYYAWRDFFPSVNYYQSTVSFPGEKGEETSENCQFVTTGVKKMSQGVKK